MAWWDNDARKETTRTLWSWGLEGRKADRYQGPMSRRARHQRSRSLAEMVEGISPRHDDERYGTGPFGSVTTGGIFLRLLKRKAG